jgi:hypothetical protein
MSFQAYLDTIQSLTKQTPESIKIKAVKQGVLVPDLKASVWVVWLAKEWKLGRGHSMALWKYFIEKGWIVSSTSKLIKNS